MYGIVLWRCHLLSCSLLGEVVCTLHLSPDNSSMRQMSSIQYLAWPETCEHFVVEDSGDSLAGRWDCNVTLGSLSGMGATVGGS